MANVMDVNMRIPSGPGVPGTVLTMLQSARRGLAEAAEEAAPGDRYVLAHLAALRAAAAIVAARGEPGRARRGKPRTVWELLTQVEPALTEWAAYFAAFDQQLVPTDELGNPLADAGSIQDS